MSLKDLLPEGTFEEISAEARAQHHENKAAVSEASTEKADSSVLWVKCPTCGKRVPYTKDNPFRPFCSERCRLLDLGAWASEQRTIKGSAVNEDEDADLLDDPNLPRR